MGSGAPRLTFAQGLALIDLALAYRSRRPTLALRAGPLSQKQTFISLSRHDLAAVDFARGEVLITPAGLDYLNALGVLQILGVRP